MAKLEIWVADKEAQIWMRDKAKNLIYQMDFSYKKSLHFTKRMILDFNPDSPEGELEKGRLELVKELEN